MTFSLKVGPYELNGQPATRFLSDLNALLLTSTPAKPTSAPANDSSALPIYILSDTDDSGTTAYYGYLSSTGAWYIKSYDGSEMRYVSGTTDYTTNWGIRVSLQYQYYNAVF